MILYLNKKSLLIPHCLLSQAAFHYHQPPTASCIASNVFSSIYASGCSCGFTFSTFWHFPSRFYPLQNLPKNFFLNGYFLRNHFFVDFQKRKKAARFIYLAARKEFFNSENAMSSIKLEFGGIWKAPSKTAESLDFTGFAAMSSILITHPMIT